MPLASLPITPQQCHDARGLLGWNGVQLAMAAHVEPIALIRFEHGRAGLARDALGRGKEALETAGIEFGQTGVTLRTPREPRSP